MQSSTIQQTQQAGKKKITAVTFRYRGIKKQFFIHLEHDDHGAAILPQAVLSRLLDKAGVRPGETYSVG